MQVGRPVLIVPTSDSALTLDHALIGWKDLSAASKHVADVVAWLGRHAIKAQGSAHLSTGDDATALYAFGQDLGADVLVAGAYGHSRVREWMYGGVTRDLLLSANRCSLVSH